MATIGSDVWTLPVNDPTLGYSHLTSLTPTRNALVYYTKYFSNGISGGATWGVIGELDTAKDQAREWQIPKPSGFQPLPVSSGFFGVTGVCLRDKESVWAVADFGDRLIRLDPKKGGLTFYSGAPQPKFNPGKCILPTHLACDTQGHIWAQGVNVDAKGTPFGMVVARFLIDKQSRKVMQVDCWSLLESFGLVGRGIIVERSAEAVWIALHPLAAGSIEPFLARLDAKRDAVEYWSIPQGSTPSPILYETMDIAAEGPVEKGRDIWITQITQPANGARVLRFNTATESFVEFVRSKQMAQFWPLMLDAADGKAWFSEWNIKRISETAGLDCGKEMRARRREEKARHWKTDPVHEEHQVKPIRATAPHQHTDEESSTSRCYIDVPNASHYQAWDVAIQRNPRHNRLYYSAPCSGPPGAEIGAFDIP